jgi:hypothetical protein
LIEEYVGKRSKEGIRNKWRIEELNIRDKK